MTLTLELTEEQEARLTARAKAVGMSDPRQYLIAFIDAGVNILAKTEQKNLGTSEDFDHRALEFYNSELREQLEAEHFGESVAIHPDTLDYALADRPGRALRTLRSRHTGGSIIVHVIGANPQLASRLRGERRV